ncbi:MAG: HAD family hydrolase, partial [Crocinitomicaceae bacterium]
MKDSTQLRYKAIIFDFDYTLADSSEGIVRCTQYAFQKMGLPSADPDEIRNTIGLPLRKMYQTLTGRDVEDEANLFADGFKEHSETAMAPNTFLFPSTAEVIRRLNNRGFTLGIFSTKYRRRMETILTREELLEPFEIVVGSEDVQATKPAPEGLIKIMKELQISAQDILFVGDSVTDAKTAQAAQVDFV